MPSLVQGLLEWLQECLHLVKISLEVPARLLLWSRTFLWSKHGPCQLVCHLDENATEGENVLRSSTGVSLRPFGRLILLRYPTASARCASLQVGNVLGEPKVSQL